MSKSTTIVEHAGSGFKMPETLATRIDELAKELPQDFKYERMARAVAGEPELGLEEGSRTEVSMITTDDRDRERDVMIPNGGDFDEFRESPDVMFAHDYSRLPVGKALWIKPKANGFAAKTKYARKPSGHGGEWLPDSIFSLLQEGMCRGKSLGFVPLSKRMPTGEELQMRPEWKGCTVIDRWKAFEYSVAPIPINPKAMAFAVAKCVQGDELREAIYSAAKSIGVECQLEDVIAAAKAMEADPPSKESSPAMPACPKCMSSQNVQKKDNMGGMYECMKCQTTFGTKDDSKSAKTPEEIAAEVKAAKLAKALDIVVPILRHDTILAHREREIERLVNDKVKQAIDDAYARRTGRV